ncbi:Protein kinase domain-containing protein [Caenorhabditis elegans]|uniref:Protein kinase domain-containing protein n=1 Tax=Caenorhabditis elegans TaxID=6239 RepID=Q4W521_CAEEL|nr:Protein kinase domain-containing protein [Caenorhabditis elegans]CCD66454.1 Protein kinase domain-containing protein [Caenorhabditis elegans]|eukprot:NP_001022010.2 Uncharacterized protein CELE_C33C12.11 [Caenorhabditis elegans]
MTKRCVDDDRTLAKFEILSFGIFSFGFCCFLAQDDDRTLAKSRYSPSGDSPSAGCCFLARDDDRTLAKSRYSPSGDSPSAGCCFLAHDDDGSLAGQLRDFFSSENRCPLLAHRDDGTLANFVIFSFIRLWLLAHDNDRDTDQQLHTLRHPLVFNLLQFGFPHD